MQVSLQLIPEQPVSELLEAIEIADALGYYACYSADEIYHKDAWLLFAAAAGRTERIRLAACNGAAGDRSGGCARRTMSSGRSSTTARSISRATSSHIGVW